MSVPRRNVDLPAPLPGDGQATEALRIRPPLVRLFAIAMLGLALIGAVAWRWGLAHYRFSHAATFDVLVERTGQELLRASELSAMIVEAAGTSSDPQWKLLWDKVHAREHKLTEELLAFAETPEVRVAATAFDSAHRARDVFEGRSFVAKQNVGMWITASPNWARDHARVVGASNAAGRALIKAMSATSEAQVRAADRDARDYQWATASALLVLAGAWVVMFAYATRLKRRHGEACEAVEAVCADQERRIGERTAELIAANARLDRQATESERLERQFRLLLDSAGEGIFGLDPEGRATFVNPAAAAILGYSPEELLGADMHAMIHHSHEDGSRFPREECPSLAAFAEGLVHHEAGCMLWRKDGTCFPADVTITPIVDDGVRSGAVVVFSDVTEQRQLVAQLMQAQKLESVGQLAAGIAHEINTPTQYIGDNVRFFADAFTDIVSLQQAHSRLREAAEGRVDATLLAEVDARIEAADWSYLAAEVPSAIAQAEEGVKRVARIVAAMKEFSHPGASRHEMTDLNHIVETTVTVARNEWKYVAEMELQLAPDLPRVPCLSGEVGQVVLNLVVNAAHAIGEATARGDGGMGRITVVTVATDDHAEIHISDTGTGIPADLRHRIFDPFFTTKGIGKGTGQGLAIARGVVVEKHGGTIDFRDNAAGGTTFTVRLPLSRPQQQSAAA